LKTLKTDILVIGSGAGGAITASLLSRKGFDVLLVEEGPKYDLNSLSPYSTIGMAKLYRRCGMTPIMGKPSIAFVEGCCVGGSTEINSGLFHRTPEDTYDKWREISDIDDFSSKSMEPYFIELERELNISYQSGDLPKSSLIMKEGAEKLGWKYKQVPRAQKNCTGINLCAVGCPTGAKQSMSVTFIPKGLQAGMKLESKLRIDYLHVENNRIIHVVGRIKEDNKEYPVKIEASDVFVCCGAIQTPSLLRRSGIKWNMGDNLRLHPTVKITAIMKDEVDAIESTLPVFQVFEFSPDIVLGGSVFSLPYAASGLADGWDDAKEKMHLWKRMVTYYALARSSGKGKIRNFPFTKNSSIAYYKINAKDRKLLSVGLARLGQLFFAAGAKELYPTICGHPPFRNEKECLVYLEKEIPIELTNLLSIHIFASCPMGERKSVSATNSFGKVWDMENLYINDASLFVDALGVNPQGTIMAIAMRNVNHYLSTRRS
jgi:choline dehydrogenase-like flavoprotein